MGFLIIMRYAKRLGKKKIFSNDSAIYEPLMEHIALKKYNDNDYRFIYEVKKNAYKKYVEECWGAWVENLYYS